jgi:putative addiction module component (TIGR02574 family)
MLKTEQEVTIAALALTRTARASLIKQLTDSLIEEGDEIEQAWRTEIKDRVRAFEAGELKAVDGPTVMDRLRNRAAR